MEYSTGHSEAKCMSRRQLLRAGAAGLGALALAGMLPATALASLAAQPARRLSLLNLHTGERCALTYWEHGRYLPEAMVQIQRVLRDHRTDAEHPIDPPLLDLLATLHGKLETTSPYQVISGYRSPASNAAMHARSNGVAKQSLHVLGKAIDIRVEGRALKDVQATALAMQLGGVGYYPGSDFVHVDTGRVRQWQGV